MTNHNISMKTGGLSDEQIIFVDSFMKPGLTFAERETYLSVSAVDLFSMLSELIGFMIDKPGTYPIPVTGGAIRIYRAIQHNNRVEFDFDIIARPSLINKLDDYTEKHRFSETRVKGVYNVNITHLYIDHKGDMKTATHYKNNHSFDKLFPEMYPKLDITDLMTQFSDSDESILILSGQPGTGKTCVAKMMMACHAVNKERDISVVYVKDSGILAKDNFWAQMSSTKPDLIILDDLDDELRPRSECKNLIVSNMLSFSDGIFDIRTKIIITTNLTDNKIDKALVRPGRAFDALKLPVLERHEAEDIWTRKMELPTDLFSKVFGDLKSISQAAVMSEAQRAKRNKDSSYLKDPSISIRKLVEEDGLI